MINNKFVSLVDIPEDQNYESYVYLVVFDHDKPMKYYLGYHDGLFDASAILGVQKWVYTKSAGKTRNNYVAIEFTLTGKPATTSFSNVEIIQVRGE